MPSVEVYNPDYKMSYPGPESYHFPTGPSHTSPCMSSFWRGQEIRQGDVREEINRDAKLEEEE